MSARNVDRLINRGRIRDSLLRGLKELRTLLRTAGVGQALRLDDPLLHELAVRAGRSEGSERQQS